MCCCVCVLLCCVIVCVVVVVVVVVVFVLRRCGAAAVVFVFGVCVAVLFGLRCVFVFGPTPDLLPPPLLLPLSVPRPLSPHAGHDTTSIALTQLFGTLPSHPDVMTKLREEQRRLVAEHGPGVSPALVRGMTYAEAVIRESMRVTPIATMLTRTAIRDFELDG